MRYKHNNQMKENSKSARNTNVIIKWENPKSARDTNKIVKWQNPKGACDTNVIINLKRILKGARYKHNNQMKENSKSARDTNVIIDWKRILKVHKMQTWLSNDRES